MSSSSRLNESNDKESMKTLNDTTNQHNHVDECLHVEMNKYREETKEFLKTLDVDRDSENWWTTPREMPNGDLVLPYESIEADLFEYYLKGMPLSMWKFEKGIARIAVGELELCLGQNHSKEFKELKWIVQIINKQKDEELFDEDMNGMSFGDLHDMYEDEIAQIYSDVRDMVDDVILRENFMYDVQKIESYKQAKAWRGTTFVHSPLCMTISENKFNGYTHNGRYAMYFVYRKDYQSIIPHKDGQFEPLEGMLFADLFLKNLQFRPYDKYGFSFMVVVVDEDGNLDTCISRWNHEFVGHSRDFLNEMQLTWLLGKRFYDVFKPNRFSASDKKRLTESAVGKDAREQMLTNLYDYLSMAPTDDIYDGGKRGKGYINTSYKAYNYFEPRGIVHNVWGIHFTNLEGYEGIIKNGFRIGVSNMDELAYSGNYYDYDTKRGRGWNFALPADNDYIGDDRGYGDCGFILKLDAVRAYHKGDTDEELIFKGCHVKKKIPFMYDEDYDCWILRDFECSKDDDIPEGAYFDDVLEMVVFEDLKPMVDFVISRNGKI